MTKILESKHKIRYSDCDPLGHLYNTKYLDYFLHAREDQLHEHYDIDFHKYSLTRGLAWVVGQHQIAYFDSARTNELVYISSAVFAYSDRTIRVEFQMWDADRITLKAIMWTTFVHVSIRDQKSHPHPEDIMHLFLDANIEIEEKDFNLRAKQLRLKQ